MKLTLGFIALCLMCACSQSPQANNSTSSRTPVASPTPLPSLTIPKDGDYPSKGVVTKIAVETGSIELNHEDIPGVMPPMLMEFFVSDKKMLEGLKVGDKVDFVLRYKHPTETIIEIKKEK